MAQVFPGYARDGGGVATDTQLLLYKVLCLAVLD